MTDQTEPDPSWNTCPTTINHGPHPWHDPWPLPHGKEAHCPGRPTPKPAAPAHGCTIDGQPAMPILVAEYNALVTRAAELEAALTAVLGLFPPDLNPAGPAVRSRHAPAGLIQRWRGILADATSGAGAGEPQTGHGVQPATTGSASPPGHDDGPTVAECREADRSWDLEKAGE